MSRLIIVSNRLPYSIERSGEQSVLRQSSGGLVSAIMSYFEKNHSLPKKFEETIWIGSVDFSPQEFEAAEKKLEESNFKIEPVFMGENVYNNYYNGFSNSLIWPLFHYFPSLIEVKKEYFEAYKIANQQFAEKILEISKPDDLIWIHDYQLMLVPKMVRIKRPEASIGFFLHIPFPSYELFRLLPSEWKNALLNGILGADLVGFHTYDYATYFIQSAKMVMKLDTQFNNLMYRNRLVRADLFPIGIDYDKFHSDGDSGNLNEILSRIKNSFKEQKIIFSVDRQDYTKGLMYRLHGFNQFLQDYPEWREKIVFVLNVIPSRDNIPAYNERKKMLEELIGTINGKYSSIDWQPIIYRYNHMEFEELKGMYQSADVALITPLRDGMNLVAKEFIASKINHRGVLILSELTGAASELNEAIIVNPTDSDEVSKAIHQALIMPIPEQQQRMIMMQKRLKEYDVVRWVTDFLDQLDLVKAEQQKISMKLLDEKAIEEIIRMYNNSRKRLLLMDYDGTLAAFTRMPSQAEPSEQLLTFLKNVTRDERNSVCIISGRDEKTLSSWLGHLPISMIAEHGASIKLQGKDWEKQTSMQPGWKDKIRPLMQLFVRRCAGSIIEEKENTLTWHYRNTQPELGFTRSRELMSALSQLITNTSLQIIDGNKVLEVRQSGIDKGMSALKLLNHLSPDFTLCIGDDTTDEDMFTALRDHGITIKIGNGNTAAHFNLLNQADVIPLLERITNLTKIKETNAYS